MQREIATRACDILRRAIQHLLDRRSSQGHWGDVRSTALACWSVSTVLKGSPVRHTQSSELAVTLADCRAWLAGQARREEGGISWESEAWDTALAVLALAGDPKYADRLDQAVAWLRGIADARVGAWYDEVWETTLSTVAILFRESFIQGPRPDSLQWLRAVVRWLSGIPSKETGEFICPHYSGFLVWLRNALAQSVPEDELDGCPVIQQFQLKAARAEEFLLGALSNKDRQLWSTYTFANSYVAYALAASPSVTDTHIARVVNWYQQRQGQHGGFEDIEDTAVAIVALSALSLRLTTSLDLVFEQLVPLSSTHSRTTIRCFLGYSGASKHVALELKDFMARMLPDVDVKDWRWDFMPGQHLYSEIDKISRVCRLAVFLVTKDDTLVYETGHSQTTPRDNVVFEIGFFAARIGMENTIMLVEHGTKVPTDLGGILYIPMQSKSDLTQVIPPLISTVQRLAATGCCGA